jgi:phosphoglycolate phosphatase
MIKAVIFDLDGTLANTMPDLQTAMNGMLTKLGYKTRTRVELLGFINRGSREFVRRSLPKEVQGVEFILDSALQIYEDEYSRCYDDKTIAYTGINDLITNLKAKGIKLAVLSNKQDEYVKNLVKQLLPEGICEIARGTIASQPAKPDKAAALEVIESLGVSSYECMLIGDSDIDIQTARNADMDSLSVSWGYASKTKLIMKGAEEIVDTPEALIEYFK